MRPNPPPGYALARSTSVPGGFERRDGACAVWLRWPGKVYGWVYGLRALDGSYVEDDRSSFAEADQAAAAADTAVVALTFAGSESFPPPGWQQSGQAWERSDQSCRCWRGPFTERWFCGSSTETSLVHDGPHATANEAMWAAERAFPWADGSFELPAGWRRHAQSDHDDIYIRADGSAAAWAVLGGWQAGPFRHVGGDVQATPVLARTLQSAPAAIAACDRVVPAAPPYEQPPDPADLRRLGDARRWLRGL